MHLESSSRLARPEPEAFARNILREDRTIRTCRTDGGVCDQGAEAGVIKDSQSADSRALIVRGKEVVIAANGLEALNAARLATINVRECHDRYVADDRRVISVGCSTNLSESVVLSWVAN